MTERVWSLPTPSQPCGGVTDENSTQDGIRKDCLRLYNSLVDRKVPFIPATGPDSKVITWYTCGPTVYDVAHMGHARNYLAFDIVRRVLEDYFGFTILYVMNVTDVDDKIILRARRNYLLAMYLSENKGDVRQLLADTKQAIAQAESKQLAKLAQMLESASLTAECGQSTQSASTSATAAAKRKEAWEERQAQEKLLLSKILVAKKALEDMPLKDGDTSNEIIDTAGDYLAEWLDQSQGSSVTDPAIFRQHAAKYEAAFLEDMELLGVRPPTVMTRVSEYIPEIIHYVEKIESQGFAYVASPEGSVYFDTQAFRKAGHTYGKLNPWAVGAVDNSVAGDGNENLKRHPSDFALWKAAKPGEPTWDSPWGAGRPGWHIECSAMASSIIGSTIDIHTGGEDLRFPHHDNELAQAEAFYHDRGCCQWVNYFLHSGHLGIEGLKMSKSLKNFITIREALNSFTPRQLRLMMVLTPWDRRMAFGEQVKEEMKAQEAQIRNFFANIDVGLRRAGGPEVPQKWASEELALSKAITLAASVVHERLLDSIDTRGAMDALSELVKATNIYLAARTDGPGGTSRPQAFLLEQCSSFVSRILSVFGLASLGKPSSGELNSKESNSDALVSGVLEAFCSFRDKVRQLARSSDAGFADAKKLLLHSCDCVRDETMVKLGVRLEDTPDGGSVWKMDDPATLQAEVDAKRAAQSEALARKLKSKLDSLVRDVEKFEKLAALPSIQESLKDKYSKFDQVSGDPTHDAEGVVLQGKPLEKAKKDVEKAKKVRAPLEKRVAEEGIDFMDTMRQEIKSIQDQLSRLQAE